MNYAALILLVASFSAHAVDASCPKFFNCGTFKLSSTADDGKEVATTVTITGKGQFSAEFVYADSVGGVAADGLHLATEFKDDGSFTMRTDGGALYAKGICLDQFCTFAIRPIAKNGLVVGNSGLLVFSGDKLTLDRFYGVPGKIGERRQNFTRQ